MTIYNNIIKILAAISLVLMSSCADDIGYTQPVPPGPGSDKVRIEVFTRSQNFDKPTTRNGGDQSGTIEKNPFVLVFNGAGASATFVEAVQVIEFSGINKRYVTLTRQPSGNYEILFLANNLTHFYFEGVRHEFTEDNLNLYLSGETLSSVSEKLLSDKLDTPRQTNSPYVNSSWSHLQPMTGRMTVSGAAIDENTKLGEPQGQGSGPIIMTRGISKIQIESTLTNFTLTGIVCIKNVPTQGEIYNYDGVVPSGIELTEMAKDDTYTTDIISIGEYGPTQANYGDELYFYEASAANSTYFILRGEYTADFGNGSETREYYYKMAIVDGSGSYFDLIRNHRYTFQITTVRGPGYETIEQAITGEPSNTTVLELTVITVDLSSHHIVTNGNYYLGVSNLRYVVYSDAAGPHHAFSISTDYFTADGRTPVVNYIRPSAGITCNGTAIPSTTTPSNQFDVKITFAAGTSIGTIEVGIGDLTRTVNVEKKWSATGQEVIPSAGERLYYYQCNASGPYWDYTYYCVNGSVDDRNTGKTWIKLASGDTTYPTASIGQTAGFFAPDPAKILEVTDQVTSSHGKIQVYIDPNTGTNAREGTFYLTTGKNPWHDPQYQVERIKFDIKQRGI
ncbi:hypothetical protein [uncultured Alistipes sp.]|nr:hypothetical protein [uncultured Alistipes sp.]